MKVRLAAGIGLVFAACHGRASAPTAPTAPTTLARALPPVDVAPPALPVRRACDPLPTVVPAGLYVEFDRRDAHARWLRAAVVNRGEPCPARQLNIFNTDRRCVALSPSRMNALLGVLRAHRLDRVPTHSLGEMPPDRGGVGLAVRWPAGRCEVSDILDSAVDEAGRADFDAATAAVIDAFNAALAPDAG